MGGAKPFGQGQLPLLRLTRDANTGATHGPGPSPARSARVFDTLMPHVWAHGATTIADTRRDAVVVGMAARSLDAAPESFVLVGISMGGYIALEVVREALGRVRALALMSTSATPDTPEQADSRRRQLDLARAGRYDDIVTAAFPLPWSTRATATTPSWPRFGRSQPTSRAEAFCTQLKAVIDRPDSRPVLSTINCPTAVIHGAGDQLITLDHGRGTAASVPFATLTVVEAAGHLAAQEQPAAVGKALDALLSQASAG